MTSPRRLFATAPAALLAALALTGSTALHAQLNYAASEIALGEWPDDVLREDMDGDGRLDLLVPHWSAEAGREMLIYLQDAAGRFPPEPSRHVEIKPEIIAVAERAELFVSTAAATATMAASIPGGTIAVVAPDAMVDDVSGALTAAGIDHARATRSGIITGITVVPVSVVKGLELDGVVVVEPAAIVAGELQGLRALYVALTRSTRQLTVVHAQPLPAAMR